MSLLPRGSTLSKTFAIDVFGLPSPLQKNQVLDHMLFRAWAGWHFKVEEGVAVGGKGIWRSKRVRRCGVCSYAATPRAQMSTSPPAPTSPFGARFKALSYGPLGH